MVATGRGPTLGPVDAHLKALAEVSLAVARAEPALGDGALTATRAALDEAQRGLALLRESWPRMSGAERAVVGKAAAAVRQRLDATAGRVPASSALSRGAPEHDPEQDVDPDLALAPTARHLAD